MRTGTQRHSKSVLIVGGGASGLIAAIAAARQGAKVTLIEKNRQAGKKLLMTGNGRCNFTNKNQELRYYRSSNPELIGPVLEAFPMEETVAFFEELGILVKDRGGYLYPNSGQAASIAGVLRLEVQRLSIKEAYNTEVLAVGKQKGYFQAECEGWTYEGDALVLACGSKAAPAAGASGDGYRFARSFGHTVVRPLPALTGLYAAEKDCKTLAGVRTDARVTLLTDGKVCAVEEGEVQFASYGLSGIPVFQISRFASRTLDEGGTCEVRLDVCPALTGQKLLQILSEENRRKHTDMRKNTDILLGMFPEKLSQVLLGRAGISGKKKGQEWTREELERLVGQMKELTFQITGSRGYEQAQVCTGGVPLKELKGISMESAAIPGLYLAGELLDVDGACGGYNLQWAWSSGYLAGIHAAGGFR